MSASTTSSAGDPLRKVRALAVLLLAVAIPWQGPYAGTGSANILPWRIERDIRRFKTVGTDNVMDLLAIRPGMTILDIGAGTGQFAYEFARRLNGTGMVYATDTNGDCVDYIGKESRRRGLKNLEPVLVGTDGMDAFYGRHKYDLITVFHISMAYEDRVDYFRELRGFLAEGGRLVLILYKIPTPFSSGDFAGDFRGLVKQLSREPEGSPFHGILRDSTRRLIRDHPEAEPPEGLRRAVAEDFNEVLSDTRFGPRFLDGSIFRKDVRFRPEERGYADWVLLPSSDGAARNAGFSPQKAPIDGRFSTINKLLIIQRYRKFLKEDGLFRSGFAPAIEAAFEQAGYRLERAYRDTIPFEDIVIFAAR